MKLIKLSAIESTNDFLKELSKTETLENFTTVTATNQTNGKGQMGAVWISESGKNIIMSTLIKNILKNTEQVFQLNVLISISIIEVLEEINIPNLAIKWPNDIMSDTKKIAGILIENRFKSDTNIESIIGIGLNVNQKDFYSLPGASSLTILMNKEFDLDLLLKKIISKIKANCKLINTISTDKIWTIYLSYLFKKDELISFEDVNRNIFSGKITGVSKTGKLEVILQDNSIKLFGIKEIQLLY